MIREHYPHLFFWGDSAFPYLFHISRFLEVLGEQQLAEQVLSSLFEGLVERNYRQSGGAFAPPYYGVEEVLENPVADRLSSDDFSGWMGSSFVIRSLLEMLVRRGKRSLIEERWRHLTYVQQHEFVPDRPEDIFSWRTESGTNSSRFPNQTESWTKLQAEATDATAVPLVYQEFAEILPFHILVCPHRATPSVLRFLDSTFVAGAENQTDPDPAQFE